MNILIATNNAHKSEEIASILSAFSGVRIMTLRDLPVQPAEPVEDGSTLEENAYIKAREIHDATGLPTLADDTGLEVDALGGDPGVYSARYAGETASYSDNCTKLVRELSARGAVSRAARFRTVMCFVDGARTLFAEGSVEGEIVESTRGSGGFGYDPLFVPAGDTRTFAEMSLDEKNLISHRGRALAQLRTIIEPYLVGEQS